MACFTQDHICNDKQLIYGKLYRSCKLLNMLLLEYRSKISLVSCWICWCDSYFKRYLNVICEFIPQLLFLLAIFGYLCALIFVKWSVPVDFIPNFYACSPNLLIGKCFVIICCDFSLLIWSIDIASVQRTGFNYLLLSCLI